MALPSTYLLYRLCGMYPFSVRKFIRAQFIASLIFVALLLLLYVLSYCILFSKLSRPFHLLTKRGYDILYLVSLLITVSSHLWGVYQNRAKFEHLFRCIHPEKMDLFELIALLVTLESMCGHVLTRPYYLPYSIDMITYAAVLGIAGTVQAMYISIVRDFEKRLSKFKLCPSQFIEEHSKCIELSATLNRIFGPQICLCVFIALLAQIIHTYEVMTSLSESKNRNPWGSFLKLVNKSSQAYIMLHASERAKREAEAFYDELFKAMRDNEHLYHDNKLVLYLTLRQPANFTACGFFNLGYPLVTSIITAATTYLVILIQFSMPASKS